MFQLFDTDCKFTDGAVDTVGNFATVSKTPAKFAAGVVETGGKCFEQKAYNGFAIPPKETIFMSFVVVPYKIL